MQSLTCCSKFQDDPGCKNVNTTGFNMEVSSPDDDNDHGGDGDFFFCGTDCRSVLMSEFTRRVSDARAKTTHNALECQAVHPRHFARPTQCRVAQARPNQKIQLRHSATTTRTRHIVEQRVKHPIEITRNRIVTPRQSHRTVNDRKSARDTKNDSAHMPLPLRDSPTSCHHTMPSYHGATAR